MRCPNRRAVAATLLLLASACSDASRPAPTQPQLVGPRASIVVPTAVEIRNQIALIFPEGGLRNASLTQFDNVDRSIRAGRLSSAQAQAGALINFVLRALGDGKLVAPAGGLSAFDDPGNPGHPLPAADAQTSAAQLVGAISLYAGLSGGPSNVDAAAVYVPVNASTDIVVKTGTGLAAVRIPPGALGVDALVTITPIPYKAFPVGDGPLNTQGSGILQYPYFYEFQTFPAIPQFVDQVLVQTCQIETGPYAPPEAIHPRLQLAHNVGAQLEILPRQFAPDLLCTENLGLSVAPMESEGWLARGLWGARELPRRVGSWFTPAVAYAAHGGLAGASSSFSPFGAVDPGTSSIQLRPNVISLAQYTSGGINFFATDANGVPLDLACGAWQSSNAALGGFDGSPFYPSGSTGTTTITAVCGSSTTDGGTPVSQAVQIVP